jgi:hypothetical protein
MMDGLSKESAMSRRTARQGSMRARIAAAAARIMAEDGVDDFALAKRKAARQLGAPDTEALPANDEVEAELQAYRALYQPEEHADRLLELRTAALKAMRLLERFRPYLTGPVLAGTAGPYAEIDLQLFPESAKDVEILLLEENIAFDSAETRRFSGDRSRAVGLLRVAWGDYRLHLSIHDPRDERLSLKTSPLGRPIERAGLAEVSALVRETKGA